MIKLFDLEGERINVKSFKVPNLINQVVYNFFRKSKAQRSFEYASNLLSLDIGTPTPNAFYERPTILLFKKSYYISQHLNCDLTYRELTTNWLKFLAFCMFEMLPRARFETLAGRGLATPGLGPK